MIIFKSKYKNLYNVLIHNFLITEGYPNNEIVEKIMPKYLYLEHYHRCLEVLSDLYNWTESGFNYTLTPFHKLMLYKFLEYLSVKKTENKKFNNQYFSVEINQLIEETIKLENTLCDTKISKQKFYNVSKFNKELFDDMEFLIIEQLYYDGMLESYLIKNNEKIDLYYEILPYKIQQRFKANYIGILNKVEEVLGFIISNSKKHNLEFMFWENDKPMKEPQIQVVLENIMDCYFCNEEIDITRESLLGRGKIDFRFYKNKNEKVLLEVKCASSSHLKSGYEK